MSQTKQDNDGYPYREVIVNGVIYIISTYTTKHTIYQDFGAVYAGPPFSFVTPAGRELAGYTTEPALVREYVEMWEETTP